jgi:hypothetical protein
MKIHLLTTEVVPILLAHLKSQGYDVAAPESLTHTEGQYDESCEVHDGWAFPVKGTLPPPEPGSRTGLQHLLVVAGTHLDAAPLITSNPEVITQWKLTREAIQKSIQAAIADADLAGDQVITQGDAQ